MEIYWKSNNVLIVILIAVLVVSCTESKEARKLFARAESVMNEYPDSAFAMLDSASVQKDSWNTREQMRYELLRAKAQNKAYIDFTTDSVMKEVTEYYDAHGTPNEQMEAHYLLGCTYRDLHESPMALSCYLDATEKADTLSDDCDYSTLMRIWGQVADEYDRQAMPYKELEALNNYRIYSLKCGDSLNYIIGVELKRRAYLIIGDTLGVLESSKKACELFKERGYNTNSAVALGPIIPIYLSKQDTLEAGRLMKIFESESCLFDSNNQIAKGQEYYYNTKALYYMCISRMDSAEYYYRKLSKYGYYYDAYKGLVEIYTKMNLADSVSKYTTLKENAFDAEFTSFHTQAMFNAEGMFNYTHNQRIAMQKELEIEHGRSMLHALCFIFVIVISLLTLGFMKYKSSKKAELKFLIDQNARTCLELNKAVQDYELATADFETYKMKKSEEILLLEKKCGQTSSELRNVRTKEIIATLSSNESIVNILNQFKLKPGYHPEISTTEWDAVYEAIKTCLPQFYSSVICNHTLSDREVRVAILSLLKISNKKMGVLLDLTTQNVTNIRAIINNKLFSDSSAKTLFDNFLKL